MQTNRVALRCVALHCDNFSFFFFFENETRQLNVCMNAETLLGDKSTKTRHQT